MSKKTIVMGVIGADIHVVGNKVIAYALEEAGFEVVNLGILLMLLRKPMPQLF